MPFFLNLVFGINAVGFVFVLFRLVCLFFKIKKLNTPGIMPYCFLTIVSLLIMVASWILNLGWRRIFLTFILFPLAHTTLFAIFNGKSMLGFAKSKKLKKYTLLSCITHIALYLSFSDFPDYTSYTFFGLLRGHKISGYADVLCIIILLAHITVLILQAVEIKRIKKQDILKDQQNNSVYQENVAEQ